MSDETSRPVVINRADGTELRLRRCSPADRYRFRAVFRAYRKAGRANSLSLLGVAGRDALPYLDEIDARRLKESEVIEWVNHPEGQREAVLLSLRADNPKATMDDVDALGLDDDGLLRAAAGVFNLDVVAAATEGDGPAGPLAGGAAGGPTGTTGGTPTPSGADSASGPTTP